MAHGFRKFIAEEFVNCKFLKILPSENFPLYGYIHNLPRLIYKVQLATCSHMKIHCMWLATYDYLPSSQSPHWPSELFINGTIIKIMINCPIIVN